MKSYQVVDFGKPLELRKYENPKPRGQEILVKISACGVCHSDLHLADGYFDLGDGKRITLADRGTKLPFTPGHEITGTVVAIGEDAKNANIGDSGIVFPWIGCGKCDACEEENETLCEAPKYLGARLDGGYSDHIIVPDSRYLVSYGDMDPAVAAPYACSGLTAYSALKKIPTTSEDDWIIIIGAGGVGINGVLLSPSVHKAKILVVDNDAAKRQQAIEAGADKVFSPDDQEEIRKIIGIGAATKGNTLLNYCKLDSDLIEYVTDMSPLKIGKQMPGSHIPIKSDTDIDDSVTHALILPWNIADHLKKKLSHLNLKFYVPQVK